MDALPDSVEPPQNKGGSHQHDAAALFYCRYARA